MPRPPAAVVMLSGGLDSAVALYWARAQGYALLPLSIEFTGRPARELEAAAAVAREAGAGPLSKMPLPFVRLAHELPSYKAPKRPVPYGYIPLRNLLFYTLAAYHADANGARFVVGGQLLEDAQDFPDASQKYFGEMNGLIARSTDGWSLAGPPLVKLPLSDLKKEEVVVMGVRLGVPFELTWSCWRDGAEPCGTCLSCNDRREAFEKAGIRDPAGPRV
ncbi:MAG TPA: 7-cyano-7-deazaguanine synthase [Candidatus Thermoplasmatota archaeon]|nr:7-cyano-7-deazaguanine synthase [Candidatus Thermoplasmatota archaeon]